MARTADRPVPSGRVSPRAALLFGCALAVLSFVLLSLTVNVLAASLAAAGFVGYVGVYTIWLKRRTPQNIVIGGAPPAPPPPGRRAAGAGPRAWGAAVLVSLRLFLRPPPLS